ncbi:hypothetical protein [Curtobacterium sp. PhB115]|uniref:hypothetical protein n=1 Tax=Curtobacterium sp. PhB115 TaxID=2485173 RepID=UPI000F4C25CA|nr:hypothetical protein [Curtobacterium sp. PhB115]ROP72743.1 hypothetical protein EDF19_1762 [Curtobacterium sp. PhB115]
MHQPSRRVTTARRALSAAAVVAVAMSPVAVASAAAASPGTASAASSSAPRTTPTSDFTADVRSIDHGRGIVTVRGTGPVGGSIGIAGDGVEQVWTEADSEGTWTAAVRVGRGERVLRVTSQVTGQVIDLPVELLDLLPPGMLATVDGIARTIDLDGAGYPGAHFVIKDNGTVLGETDVDADGSWSFTLRDLAFGSHHVEAWQYFDGTHNGGVDEVYALSGAAVVTSTTASRETERVSLAGKAPAGTTLRFSDDDGPVLGADGRPVTATAAADTTWSAELPIPAGARFWTVTVDTYDGSTSLGTTEARITVPIALTGTVEELPDGHVRLSGGGEVGGVVSLETEDGKPIADSDGTPVQTSIGRTWELTLPRAVLPDDVVVARQRVDGVEQGALRLVLPKQPVGPGPHPGDGGGSGSGGDGGGSGAGTGVSTGVHPTAQGAAAGRVTEGSTNRLAYTGTDPSVPVSVAGALVAVGAAGLSVAQFLRRRGARRH